VTEWESKVIKSKNNEQNLEQELVKKETTFFAVRMYYEKNPASKIRWLRKAFTCPEGEEKK